MRQPDGGTAVRSRVLAECLAALGRPAAIVSSHEPGSVSPTPDWARSIETPRRSGVRYYADLVSFTRRAAATSDLVIIANAALLPVVTAARVKLPVIWDTNECQSLHYQRMPRSPDTVARRTAWMCLERWAAHSCRMAIAIGETEARHWAAIHPSLAPKLATMDHARFAASRTMSERIPLAQMVQRPLQGPVLVFVGTLAAKHNQAAVDWIIRVLGPSLPATTTVVICGPGTERLRGEHSGARVEALGMVEDLDSVIEAADLCLAPLASGAGVKTKVLDYLAHAKRVVGTPFAFEGIRGAPGLIEVPLDRIPETVTWLLENREPADEARARAAAAAAWMEAHHGRGRVVSQLQEILRCL